MSVSTAARMTAGDFLDRVRRPAYGAILLATVALGYVATPATDANWVIMHLGSYRGVYNSAYIGAVTAMASALWLTLCGFYVVRNAIARDTGAGPGELLAATPVHTATYLLAKFLASVLVLASMLGVLAVAALVIQIARGESTGLDPVALVTPFLLIALPMVVLTAAAALLFEAIPALRGGLGNIVWFVVWMVVAVGGQSPDAPLGGIGVHSVVSSMRDEMVAKGIDMGGEEFSLGLTYLDRPLKTFEWSGFDPDAGFLLGRLALIVLAVGVALLPALWFARFDPARGARNQAESATPGTDAPTAPDVGAAIGASSASVAGTFAASAVGPVTGAGRGTVAGVPIAGPRESTSVRLPAGRVNLRGGGLRLLVGELRVLLQGVSRWWWLGALAISVAALLAPARAAATLLLPVAWIWPVLIWSRLGTQRHEFGVDVLIGAYPRAGLRMLAEWLAGVVLTAATALTPLLRMAFAADLTAVQAWSAAVLFIPSLALALGVLSRTHRLFQIVYLALWYAAVNGVPVVDYMGLTGGLPPVYVGGAALALLALVFVTGQARRALGS